MWKKRLNYTWKLLINKWGLGYSHHVAGVVPESKVPVKLQTLVCGRELQRQDTLPRMHQQAFSYTESRMSSLCQPVPELKALHGQSDEWTQVDHHNQQPKRCFKDLRWFTQHPGQRRNLCLLSSFRNPRKLLMQECQIESDLRDGKNIEGTKTAEEEEGEEDVGQSAERSEPCHILAAASEDYTRLLWRFLPARRTTWLALFINTPQTTSTSPVMGYLSDDSLVQTKLVSQRSVDQRVPLQRAQKTTLILTLNQTRLKLSTK